MSPRFIRPFEILQRVSPVAYRLTYRLHCKAYMMYPMCLAYESTFRIQITPSSMNPCRLRRTSHMWKILYEYRKDQRRSSEIGVFLMLKCFGSIRRQQKQPGSRKKKCIRNTQHYFHQVSNFEDEILLKGGECNTCVLYFYVKMTVLPYDIIKSYFIN